MASKGSLDFLGGSIYGLSKLMLLRSWDVVNKGNDFCFMTFYSLLSKKVNLSSEKHTYLHGWEQDRGTYPHSTGKK